MKTNHKSYYVIGVILVVVVLFTIFHNKPSTSNKVGIMVPLSGVSASFGERVKNGVSLAVDEIARTGGTLVPIFGDDRGEAATAVTVANKLITMDGVHIIIGTVKSDAMLAVAPITEKNKVILFSPTAGAASISSSGDFVFRNIELPRNHGDADAQFFIDHGISRTAVFIANASNAQGYGNAFISSFTQIGIVVATSTYNQADTDFHTIIAKVLTTKPQGVYLAVATAKDAGLLVKQLRETGFAGIIMASVAADAPEFFSVTGSTPKDMYVSTSFFDASIEPARSYNELFKAKYDEDSDAFAANAYDATMILYSAMESCGNDTNTECIRDYLYRIKNYAGVSGTTTFDSNGDVIKPVLIKVARDRKFVTAQ